MANVGVILGARADFSFQSFAVDLDQAEAGPESFVPFEVVEERPMEIASDVDTIFDGLVNRKKSSRQKFFSQRIARISETIFGNVDGLMVWFQLNECSIDGLGIELPAKVSLTFIWIFVETVIDHISIIVIESDEVLVIFDVIQKPAIPEGVRPYFEYATEKSI